MSAADPRVVAFEEQVRKASKDRSESFCVDFARARWRAPPSLNFFFICVCVRLHCVVFVFAHNQVTALRETLADVYQRDEQFTDAARVLARIPLDSGEHIESKKRFCYWLDLCFVLYAAGQRILEPTYKVQVNVRIARLFLEDEDNVEAERYLNRASEIVHLVTDPRLLLAYRGAFVRVLDFKRQFLKSALKYHQMSQDPLLNDDGQMQALDSAHKWYFFVFVFVIYYEKKKKKIEKKRKIKKKGNRKKK